MPRALDEARLKRRRRSQNQEKQAGNTGADATAEDSGPCSAAVGGGFPCKNLNG